MKKTTLLLAVGALLLVSIAASSTGLSATQHRSGCHARHTRPSDHHTYKWKDPRTGMRWNCAKRDSPKYNRARDQKKIRYGGRTYYCRRA